MPDLLKLKSELRKLASVKRAEASRWFFKTGPGEYGEGDKFLGVNNPGMRQVAKKFPGLPLADLHKLLESAWHEERQTSLFILVHQYEKGDEAARRQIYKFYLAHSKRINNWDLVDLSAHKIVGEYLLDKPRNILYRLAKSKNLWQRRIAIISTAAFIRRGDFSETLKISKILLKDEHDLIHKAVGWMLREVGKRDRLLLEKFLHLHHKIMPRVMLRYAIEKFNWAERHKYLKKA